MMFGLTKREQRWAAEQKAAETIVPLLTAAIEARTAMDTNDRIAALERDLAAAQALQAEMQTKAHLADEFLTEIERNLPDYAPANSPAEVICDLINERDEARAERDKWKAMAEWQYGVRVYPHNMSLRKGALDAYIKTWSPDAAIEARKEGV